MKLYNIYCVLADGRRVMYHGTIETVNYHITSQMKNGTIVQIAEVAATTEEIRRQMQSGVGSNLGE